MAIRLINGPSHRAISQYNRTLHQNASSDATDMALGFAMRGSNSLRALHRGRYTNAMYAVTPTVTAETSHPDNDAQRRANEHSGKAGSE